MKTSILMRPPPRQLVTAASADQVITHNSTSVVKGEGGERKKRENAPTEDILRIISAYHNFCLVFIVLAFISI